jgi:hypothetical protein
MSEEPQQHKATPLKFVVTPPFSTAGFDIAV